MKLGLVLVFTLIWQLVSSEVYFDQSGYGYGVNPKPSASSESKIVNPVVVNGGSSESVSPQESKPEAYLVRLKPKEDQAASSIQNKKSKFLLLLRLPEDQEDTQATSLNSEIQQRDESGYQQTDNQSQDEYLSPLSQTSYTPSSFENQKDESDQYQLQAGPQQQQSEADLAQQKDSGYLQPLQTDGYSQPQNNEQSQQRDESYGQQYQSQQPQQQDVPEDFEQQAKDDSGYQQQTYSQQQDSGFEQVPAPSPQFQASALKNGFNPLPSYERQPAQVPTADAVKGFSNNFFRSPVLQDSVKTTGSYNSNDFQPRDTETQSYGGQQSGVKTPAVQSQASLPSSYGFNADSGRKTNSSSSYLGASRDATKSSFQPSFYPSSDSGRKSSTPTGETSSYPSQRSPMKSPAQVYAQQQQQQIEQERKPVSSPVRDFYSQSEQYESDSFGSQQGFGPSTYGSNEASVKSAALPAKDTSNYEAQQDGVKTSPLSSPKQALEKTRPNLVASGYSNTYSSTASLARSPVSSYASQQQVQEQPQQQTQLVQEQPQQQAQQQDDYNQSAQDTEDSQEKDEQSQFSADQQQNSEPEKKVPVILISLPRESNPFASSDNQNKNDGTEYSQQQQQSFDSQPKSDSDYQHSSGSLGNDESNYNAPVKGQAPLSSFDQSSQSLQTGSYGQQSAPALGQKAAQQYPTKSSVKTQQSSIDSSSASGVPAAPVKGGRSPQPTSNYDNEYSGGFQVASKDTKSNTKSSFSTSKNFQSPAVKGGSSQQQSFDDSYSNEQQEPVKGSSQPNQNNDVQSSYSATLQAPVKAARAFQQSAGYYSEFQASKGVSDSYSRKPQQSPVESKYNDFQASPIQQSQPEPQQQTKSDAGYNLQSSVKGGRPQALPQQTSVNNYNSYQSNSQSSFSDYQSSSGAAPQQQQIPFGYSSAFKASPVQQISNYESTSQQKVSGGVKGTQNSPVQQQPQRDSYSFPNPSAQPAFASFAASVKGSALSSPQTQQTSQNSDEGYSSGYQVPEASLAPVQQTQPSRGYNAGFQASGVKGGQQQSSGYNSQSSSSYEQSPLSNTQGTKSAPIREQKIAPSIPNYQTKLGRSQPSSTKSTKTVSSYDQKSPSSGYAAAPTFPQQQQGTKSPVKSQPNTKNLLKNPTTSYLPALSPPGGLKSPVSNSKSPSSEKSTSQDSSSYFNFPMNSQQSSQAPKSSPLTRSLPPPPALVARSRPSAQNFNFPSSPSTQPSSESYPSYSASSNSPIFDDEEDSMSAITPDNMGAYGLRTNSPYGGTTASASSHIRAVEQPQGSGRVVLLLFNKGHINPQGPQMAFNSGPSGIY